MANDVYWTPATPQVMSSEVAQGSIPVRVAGAAATGAQDVFKQVPLSQLAGLLGAGGGGGGGGAQITDYGAWSA